MTTSRFNAPLASLGFCLAAATALAQTPSITTSDTPWRTQSSPVTVELRGLSVASDRVAWASGAKGTILRTVDGETWSVIEVPGAEARDFRDIEAWDSETAVALSIGTGDASAVYKTTDGGASWRQVFSNPDPTGFWDAITFWDRQHGALFGDPVEGRFPVFLTDDGGESWKRSPDAGMPMALDNEGAFAASGSCLVAGPAGALAFVTGGAVESRVFVSMDGGQTFAVAVSPIPAGAASKGLFSLAWIDEKTLITVGGDYKLPALEGIKASLSHDGGAHWASIAATPGFLSSVVRRPDGSIIAVGLAGTGLSKDGGKTWRTLDASPYNTVAFAPNPGAPAAGWAVGPRGTIARWNGVLDRP